MGAPGGGAVAAAGAGVLGMGCGAGVGGTGLARATAGFGGAWTGATAFAPPTAFAMATDLAATEAASLGAGEVIGAITTCDPTFAAISFAGSSEGFTVATGRDSRPDSGESGMWGEVLGSAGGASATGLLISSTSFASAR